MPGQEAANRASAFTITELTGDQRVLRLMQRALPYRPFSLVGTQRIDTTWYPGNPIATQQAFGASEEATSIRGQWKDRFIKATIDASFQLNPISTAPAALNGVAVEDVMALAKLVDDMRRKGQQVEVTWDEITRVGTITRFKQDWLRRQDLEYEIEFTWLSQGDAHGPAVFTQESSVGDVSASVGGQTQRLLDDSSGSLPLLPNYYALINNSLGRLLSSSDALTSLVANQTNASVGPFDAVRNTTGVLNNIVDDARALMATTQSRPAATLFIGLAPSAVPFGRALLVAAFNRTLRNDSRRLRDAALVQRELFARRSTANLLATVVARDGEDLRDISQRFYSTPNEWRRLLVFNGLPSSALHRGQVIDVPKLQNARS